MSLLPADLELLDDEVWTHEAIPTTKDEGAGIDKTKRRLAKRLVTEIDFDSLDTTITDLDMRHVYVRLWRTWHTDEAPSNQYQGTASLDVGAGEIYVRTGDAWVENPAAAKAGLVQIVKVHPETMRLGPAGLLLEPFRANLLSNPAFKDGVSTGWTTIAGAADTTDRITEIADSPQSNKLTRVGTGNCRTVHDAVSLVADTAYFLSLYHKDDSAVKLQVAIIRSSPVAYWQTGNTWGASFHHDLPVRSAPGRSFIGPIIKDGATGDVSIYILAESGSGQINHVYVVQLENGRFATSPLPVQTLRSSDNLKFENFTAARVWDVVRGDADLVYVPNGNSADLAAGMILTLFDVYFDASNYMRLQYDVTAGAFQFLSRVVGTTYTASKVQALTRGTAYVIGVRHVGPDGEEGLAPYTISLFVNGVKGTDAVPPNAPTMVASPYMFIGQDQAGTNHANGALRHLKVRPFPLSDDEHVSYP